MPVRRVKPKVQRRRGRPPRSGEQEQPQVPRGEVMPYGAHVAASTKEEILQATGTDWEVGRYPLAAQVANKKFVPFADPMYQALCLIEGGAPKAPLSVIGPKASLYQNVQLVDALMGMGKDWKFYSGFYGPEDHTVAYTMARKGPVSLGSESAVLHMSAVYSHRPIGLVGRTDPRFILTALWPKGSIVLFAQNDIGFSDFSVVGDWINAFVADLQSIADVPYDPARAAFFVDNVLGPSERGTIKSTIRATNRRATVDRIIQDSMYVKDEPSMLRPYLGLLEWAQYYRVFHGSKGDASTTENMRVAENLWGYSRSVGEQAYESILGSLTVKISKRSKARKDTTNASEAA